jgi:hypothetical protein
MKNKNFSQAYNMKDWILQNSVIIKYVSNEKLKKVNNLLWDVIRKNANKWVWY